MDLPSIIIATPHQRNALLEAHVRASLPSHRVLRLSKKDELTIEALEKIRPEYVFFPHWSWLIPSEIHSRWECVIFHMTDLPFGRGGSPLQNLICRGFKETMMTALRCNTELDAGPIYLKRALSLAGSAEETLGRASELIAEMIVEIVNTQPTPVAQQGEVVEFIRRRPADGDLTPLQSTTQVYDFIRMLDAEGYPSAFIDHGNFHFDFSEAKLNREFVEAKVRIRKKK